MFKRILVLVAVASALAFGSPLAASAEDYTEGAPCHIDTPVVSSQGTATVICKPGTWAPSELVDWTLTGENGANAQLALFSSSVGTLHFAKHANADGSDVLHVTLPAGSVGAYTIRGAGQTSGHVCVVTLTVLPADHAATTVVTTGSGLADTGSVIATWAAWVGGGLVAAGVITVALLAWARRVKAP